MEPKNQPLIICSEITTKLAKNTISVKQFYCDGIEGHSIYLIVLFIFDIRIALLCNNINFSKWSAFGHPV